MIYKIHKFFTVQSVHSKLPLLDLVTYFRCKLYYVMFFGWYAHCTLAHYVHNIEFYFREKIRFNYAQCPLHSNKLNVFGMSEPDTGISSIAFRTWNEQNRLFRNSTEFREKPHAYENPTAENGTVRNGNRDDKFNVQWNRFLPNYYYHSLQKPETWIMEPGTLDVFSHIPFCPFKVFTSCLLTIFHVPKIRTEWKKKRKNGHSKWCLMLKWWCCFLNWN